MKEGMMVDDELEPAPNPTKVRDPRSRQPKEPPARVNNALRSLNEKRAFSIRRPTEAEALEVKSEISAAVYYLRRWKKMDIRVRPYVTQHWEDPEGEHTVLRGERAPAGADVYWKTNFWVHPPLERGFRRMSEEEGDDARRRSAEVRAIPDAEEEPEDAPPASIASRSDIDRVAARLAGSDGTRPRRRRSVQERGLQPMVPPARPLISHEPPERGLVAQGALCVV